MDTDDEAGTVEKAAPRRARWVDVRDVVLFVLGAIAFVHELLSGSPERPYLLALSGVMMGVGKALETVQHALRKGRPE